MTAAPDTEELSTLLNRGPVHDLRRLSGGASRQMWSFVAGDRRLVFRRDPPGAPSTVGMEREAGLLRAARAAGMAVPDVLLAKPSYLVMSWLDGETLPRRILRDDRFADARQILLPQCAQQLALLHTRVSVSRVEGLPVLDPLVDVTYRLDNTGEPHPAFELALRWLAINRPEPVTSAVLHGDFRLGNLMVDESGLVAVLDWELAHVGDPVQDLAWLCVRSWRFGSPLPAAGLGTRQQLVEAYTAAGGAPVDASALHWWEVFCTLNWGVMCVEQARVHLTGGVRSVELAAVGRRACEVELDVLDLLPVEWETNDAPAPGAAPPSDLHDRPSVAELLEAVREFLATLDLTGHDAFLRKVSDRVLRVVERETSLGPVLDREHADRLAGLGVADTQELATLLRMHRVAPETVTTAIRAAVVAKLHVADPAQLHARFSPDTGRVAGR